MGSGDAPLLDTAPAQQRDAFWDNYKGLLQLLVIYMHAGGPTFFALAGISASMQSLLGKLLLNWMSLTAAVAMPGFFFVSGYFSSTDLHGRQRLRILQLAVVWLIQRAIWTCMIWAPYQDWRRQDFLARHPDLNATNAALERRGKHGLAPPGSLPFPLLGEWTGPDWYLWALVIHRCILPVLMQLRRPLLASLLLGVGTMFTDAAASVLLRGPLGFLPFFVLGHLARERRRELQELRESKAVRVCFGLCIVVGMLAPVDIPWKLLMGNLLCLYGGDVASDYSPDLAAALLASGGDADGMPLASRSEHCQTGAAAVQVPVFYLLSSACVLCFMALVPSGPVRLVTLAGANSIYVYLLQTFDLVLLGPLVGACVSSGLTMPVAAMFALTIAHTVGVWALLSRPCAKRWCSPIVEPRVEAGCLAVARAA